MHRTMSGTNRHQSGQTMKNTGVLTLSEFKSMRDRLYTGGMTEDQERKNQEKQELIEKSKARVKNWPNTIQALRKKKDDARFERFKKEEEERRKVDAQEIQHAAKLREEVLEKANQRIYEVNDRVKSFQTAMLAADCMKEREAQVEINKKKREIQKIIDDRYSEVEKENMRLFDEREKEKKRIEEEKRKKSEQILKDQHDQFKLRYLKRLQDEKIEGEIIKKKAREGIEEQKREEQRRRDRAIQAQSETKKANEQLEEIRRVEREKELQKEREIEAFAKKKEEIMEMRKLREELKFKEKQAARQKIIDDQVERLRKIKNKEDQILAKHIKEAEIKAEENERIKREKREQLARDIDKHIHIQLDKKAQEKIQQKQEDKNFQEFWQHKNKQLEDQENKDIAARKERARLLNEYHQKQAAQKQKRIESEIYKEIEDTRKMQAAIEEEEKIFDTYASKCLQEWQDAGKNIKPLLLELAKYKDKTR